MKDPEQHYVIGVDYGTDSVRSLIVNCANGQELVSAVFEYPQWMEGKYCAPELNQFRHHPADYIEGLHTTIKECLANVSKDIVDNIRAISVDTTGSTPCLTDENGQPLALIPRYAENPNAMFILWKDHTSVQEADDINRLAKSWGGEDYTQYEGGVYSSEWFWAKILHVFRNDEEIKNAAVSAIELCDWVPLYLTGVSDVKAIKRSRCAAGHKAMWHQSWGGLPDKQFLELLDPALATLCDNLYVETYTSDKPAGVISKEIAKSLGLNEEVVIGVGAFDAHMGALGAGIKPFSLVKIMGTSTCDILVAPKEDIGDRTIEGICGQVDGSVIPDMIGLEAGQSSFGDVYAWFKDLLIWPIESVLSESDGVDLKATEKVHRVLEKEIISRLEEEARKVQPDESSILAIDWLNGRRTPNANQMLKGGFLNLNLSSNPPKMYRALVESTAFGARKINDCFESQGIAIKEMIGIGGVSKKSAFIMQILADVMNRPLKICDSEQACALGAAICAAVAAGIYPSIEEAQKAMSSKYSYEFTPNPDHVAVYNNIYSSYEEFCSFAENLIMKGVVSRKRK